MENQSGEGRFLWPGVAVVCACIVGAGVYFGLKDSAPAPVAPASSPATGTPAPSSYSQHRWRLPATPIPREWWST